MLTNALIANMRSFLARVDLKGAEVPALVEILQTLDALEQQNNAMAPKPPPDSPTVG